MSGKIDTQTLKSLIETHTPMVLIDARMKEYDDGKRIPGAKSLNAKSSADEIAKAIGRKDTLIVTYCSNVHCPASSKMADHLSDLGYTNVLDYSEGIQGWTAAGYPTNPVAIERTVTFQGNPLHLAGHEIREGDFAPDFELENTDMKPVKLSDFKGKIVVLVTVPSLDTPVCDLETRKFNQKAAEVSDDVEILVASMDLPFAQKRWCGAAGIRNLITISDYRSAQLGRRYGVLISELHLLARAVFVIDRNGVVQYRQIVDELTKEPDYEQVLSVVDNLTAKQSV